MYSGDEDYDTAELEGPKKMGKVMSTPYKRQGKLFRYNFEVGVVEFLTKVNAAMRKDNAEWMKKFGKPLWDAGDDGYHVIDTVGLSKANWVSKDDRDYYLDQWIMEMDEFCASEVEAEFGKKG